VRISREDCLRPIAKPRGNDVDGNPLGERECRRGVPEHVQRSSRETGRLAQPCECFSKALRMDRPAQDVSEDEVTVDVSGAGRSALGKLNVSMLA
jgi:hypothetical protein